MAAAGLAMTTPGVNGIKGAGNARADGSTDPTPEIEAADIGAVVRNLTVGTTDVSPTGTPQKAITVDGILPGPVLRVKEGELVRFQVTNTLPDVGTTIHWHGGIVPNPMDGVPSLTQKPIAPNRVFVYEYRARQTGTCWYHSHVGLQEQKALSGPLIFEPKREPLSYDKEFVLFFQDWLNGTPEETLAQLRKPGQPNTDAMAMKPGQKMNPLLAKCADVNYDAFLLNGRTAADAPTFTVSQGDKVRLRLINGSGSSIFRVMVDGHEMTVTHTDGPAVKPVVVDNLVMGTAERYDVLVTVKESGAFAVRAMAMDGTKRQAIGYLVTAGASVPQEPGDAQWKPRVLEYSMLQSAEPVMWPSGEIKQFNIPLEGDMAKYVWSMGPIPYKEPEQYDAPGQPEPLLVKLGEVVDITMTNKTMMCHPMHLHGHYFRIVTGHEQDLASAPLKDTVLVPPKGSVRIQFLADNPGTWFYHCHNLYHLASGMARVVEYAG